LGQQQQQLDGGQAREGSKAFRCPQCPKAFANNSYLSQHMRIHLGIRAFGPCQFCGKKVCIVFVKFDKQKKQMN
jgi:uncharacterized C2H2 Zn-finger protein